MKRTQFSQQGLDFVTLFNAKFARQSVSGYRPNLREPIAETTAGGAQATQHMVFEPEIDGDPVITIGLVNVATKTAKLRTYDCLRQLHEMRFRRKPFNLDQTQYKTFFDRASEFLRRQNMQLAVETRPPATRSSAPPPDTEEGSLVVWFLLSVFLIGALLVIYLVVSGRL